jgi:threonine/homoserine/homoserine lactone efflux protein
MGELAAFLGIAILVIVTPGQDTALTIRNSLLGGRPAGIATAGGVALGQAFWTLAASVGLAALLVASEPVFVALKLVGAAYLVYLGLHALWQALRPAARAAERVGSGALAPSRAFRQGLLSNLGNPKMAVFFTSLLPQFASSFWGLLALGLLFCSLTLAWLSAYSRAVARAGDLLRRPRVRRSLDALTGTLLVAFGIRLAADR